MIYFDSINNITAIKGINSLFNIALIYNNIDILMKL